MNTSSPPDKQKKLVIIGVIVAVCAYAGFRLGGDGGQEKNNRPAAKEVKPAAKATPILSGLPSHGPEQAKVTVIEISDFECPFCSRGGKTVKEVMAAYKDDVRVVFLNLPLSFHNNARPAAAAALAANRQGKFWQMHDKLFANQRGLTSDNFRKWAGEIGLNLKQFDKDLADPALAVQVSQDIAIANGLGITGTPAFFINGKKLSGAQPLAKFKELIDAQITLANDEIGKGTALADVHEALWRVNNSEQADNAIDWLLRGKNLPKPVVAVAKPAKKVEKKVDKTIWKVQLHGREPMKGPANAPITIVEFTDFECPFCSKARDALKEVEKKYGNKVRIAFKNQPLPFHKKAVGAAEAALCALDDGKFWQMEERLFANQKKLSRSELTEHAAAVGLDANKFSACMASRKYKQHVLDESKNGGSGWRDGYAGILRQRTLVERRPAFLGLQSDHRRGVEKGRRVEQEGHQAGETL